MPENGVAFNLNLHPDEDDEDNQILALESLPYWSHNFDLYASDPEFPHSDRSPAFLNRRNHPYQQPSPTPLSGTGYDAVSEPDSVVLDTVDPFGFRENQVNFVMDLFQQRVERSRVDDDLFPDAVVASGFGVVEENYEMDMDNFDLDLGLGFGSESNNDFRFMVECCCDDDDGLFVERRGSGSESGEAPSTVSGVETFANSVQVVGFGSDSEYEDDQGLGIDLHLEDEYGLDEEDNDEDASIPLCWDSLRLDDHRETNDDFEWEEVDGRVDEREVFSMLMDGDEEGSIAFSVSPTAVVREEETIVEQVGNLEWEVLLNIDNLERNHGLGQDGEPYFGDHDDYIYTAEYEMLFGQFAESENALMGRPPASRSVVQNLLTVVLTEEDTVNNNLLCAVCKDEINVGVKATQLPCTHRYHGDCILPWLAIRNTCPVCRYELPTDDTDYERRKALQGSPGM